MDFYVYRLHYKSRAAFEKDMLTKGVFIKVDNKIVKSKIAISIIELGYPVLESAEYDKKGDEVKPAKISKHFHADIKVKEELTFPKSVAPKINTPFHGVEWAKGAKNN